jgi:hypothetical protein
MPILHQDCGSDNLLSPAGADTPDSPARIIGPTRVRVPITKDGGTGEAVQIGVAVDAALLRILRRVVRAEEGGGS